MTPTDQPPREGRLGIGVIGAGHVGPVLAHALAGAGHQLTGINAIGDEARERVEAMLPGLAIRDIDDIVRTSELVLFAIPGSELPQLIQGLTDADVWQPGQILVHTAPELGYTVFKPAFAAGIIPLALHPALVFTGTTLDLARMPEATVAVTAPGPVIPIGQALAVEIGGEPVLVADDDRKAYADALDAAQQFSRAVVTQATDALREIGLSRPDRVVGGLVRAAVDEALMAAAPSQDGPIDPDQEFES
ncbi:MAG: Rossmann-like and DUF2520 domain-containing protein [Canibacter sp.]